MAGRAGIPTGVHVVLERDGKVLLMRRAGTGFFDGQWSLPGGHVDEGESLRDAACRESLEELGLQLAPENLTTLGVVHRRSDTNRIDFFLQASDWKGEAVIAEPEKCDALAWHAREELPPDTVPYVRTALNQAGVPWLLESGW